MTPRWEGVAIAIITMATLFIFAVPIAALIRAY